MPENGTAEPRTLVRPHDGTDGNAMIAESQEDFFELCIDEQAGCGFSHSHDWGHDFPMSRDELIQLRDQINAALSLQEG